MKTERMKVILTTVLLVLLGMAAYGQHLQGLWADNVLRLHILANSNSERDQAVKLAVRDEVLNVGGSWFDGEDIQQAKACVLRHKDELEQLCEDVMLKNGIADTAAVSVERDYFETRQYEDFSLPAGTYETVRIELGEAKGKNWWCVMYPPLCLSASIERDTETLCTRYGVTDEAVRLMTAEESDESSWQLRFRFAEWCGQLWSKIEKE